MKKKDKLIYVFAFRSSFIRKDEELLRKYFDVVPLFFNPLPRWKTPLSFIKQVFQLLVNIRNCKGIVCQFAGFHTVAAVIVGKLFGVKTSIILLGAECHNYPGIQHGNFRKKWLGKATRFSFRWASQLLPIDKSLIEFQNEYDLSEPRAQGFKGINPDIQTTTQVIPHGFDGEKFKPNATPPKALSFITASSSVAPPVFQRKGIDLILQIAPKFPQCSFTILCKNDYLKTEDLPNNVSILEAVPYEKLPEVLASYQFYLQVSIAEGLPNALCEAMLCGCIPIGSNVFAIQEVIGNTGFIVQKRSVENLEEQIQFALQNTDQESLSTAARKRILDKFPLESREVSLIKAIQE
jgi:glycosyltransferase involved in cell wall biosynthesis